MASALLPVPSIAMRPFRRSVSQLLTPPPFSQTNMGPGAARVGASPAVGSYGPENMGPLLLVAMRSG